MTIKLSNAEEHELVVRLAEGLEASKTRFSFVVQSDFKWANDLTTKLPTDAQSKIDRYLGESGLSQLLTAEIDNRLERLPSKLAIAKNAPYTAIPFLANPLPFAREVVSTLKQIPFRYRMTVPLPAQMAEYVIGKVDRSITLPSGVTITSGGALSDDLPMSSSFEIVDNNLFNDWIDSDPTDRTLRNDLFYLSVPIIGYAYAIGSSALARQAEDYLRAFYGAAIDTGLFDNGYTASKVIKEHQFIMFHDEKTREFLLTEPQEEELYKRRSWCSTKGFAARHTTDISQAYRHALMKIGTIFTDNLDCRRLFAACIWFYRAKVNGRPLDALIQATIAIEVMLGDRKSSEGIGLTNLLSSRCAYLLGRSTDHRAKIGADFRKVYDLRSEVVHEGRHILKTGDREIVQLAIRLCAAIISKELSIRAIDAS